MDKQDRRNVLRLGGAALLAGLAGCISFRNNGDEIRDSDGDGVIDSEDYAPRDASVQRAEQVQEATSTPTETDPQTPTETDPQTPTETDPQTPTETPEEVTATPEETETETATSGHEWEFTTENKAGVESRGGPIEMWVENCSTVTADKDLSDGDELTVSFDWTIIAEGWWEWSEFIIRSEESGTIWRGTTKESVGDAKIFESEADGTTSGSFQRRFDLPDDDNIYVRFAIKPSNNCSAGDHIRTTVKVQNISISMQ